MKNSKTQGKAHGFSRLPETLRRVPISRSAWWAGIQDGRYPRGIKLSERTTAWLNSDLDELEGLLADGKDWKDRQEPKDAA